METFCVVKFELHSKDPIGFKKENIGDLSIEEITNYSIVSLAIPDKNEKVLSNSIFHPFKLFSKVAGIVRKYVFSPERPL